MIVSSISLQNNFHQSFQSPISFSSPIKASKCKHMEISNHGFSALFPLAARAKHALSDCEVDGNFAVKPSD